jgi:UDP-N-acetylmuramate-alanine ligase
MHYHLIGICGTAMASLVGNVADNKYLMENVFEVKK